MSIAKNIRVASHYANAKTVFTIFNHCLAVKSQIILILIDAADLRKPDVTNEQRTEIWESIGEHITELRLMTAPMHEQFYFLQRQKKIEHQARSDEPSSASIADAIWGDTRLLVSDRLKANIEIATHSFSDIFYSYYFIISLFSEISINVDILRTADDMTNKRRSKLQEAARTNTLDLLKIATLALEYMRDKEAGEPDAE